MSDLHFVNCRYCNSALTRPLWRQKAVKHGSFCDGICLGLFRSEFLTGIFAANYKTGSRKDRKYIEVHAPWHPARNKRGYYSLHRLIAEATLGRYLTKKEVVHHIDDDPTNNHWSNLEVCSQAKHAKEHNTARNRGKNGQYL